MILGENHINMDDLGVPPIFSSIIGSYHGSVSYPSWKLIALGWV